MIKSPDLDQIYPLPSPILAQIWSSRGIRAFGSQSGERFCTWMSERGDPGKENKDEIVMKAIRMK
jgi:hypothetical protein